MSEGAEISQLSDSVTVHLLTETVGGLKCEESDGDEVSVFREKESTKSTRRELGRVNLFSRRVTHVITFYEIDSTNILQCSLEEHHSFM